MSRLFARRFAPSLLSLESRSTPSLFAVGSTFPALGTNKDGEYALNDIVEGDFNGDGIQDVIAINTRTGTFQVFQNNGKGHFTPGNVLTEPTAGQPGAAVVADFNADGKLDVLTTFVDLEPGGSDGDAVIAWLGKGDGTFTAAPGGTLKLEAWSAASGDFNSDGKLDIALVSPDGVAAFGTGGFVVLLGDGAGSFSQVADPLTAQFLGSFSTFAADFDADGKLDFASPDSPTGGGAQVVFGSGNGSAAQVVTLPAPAGLSGGGKIASATVGDFTGDGKPDLLVAYQNNELYLFVNKGGRQFADPVLKYTGPGNAFEIRTSDFNSDGVTDVVLAEMNAQLTEGQASVLLGDGTGSFAAANGNPFVATGGAYKVAVGEFTGDGAADVILGNFSSDTLQLLSNTSPRPTSITLTGPENIVAGGTATIVATVTATGAVPTGTVTFKNAGAAVGSAAVGADGKVSFTFAGLPVGAHTLTAEFLANDAFQASTSEPILVQVIPVVVPPTLTPFAVGTDRGSGLVAVFGANGQSQKQLEPFVGATGGVRTATADFTGDGVADLVVATGPGMATLVQILDGTDGSEVFAVAPFESSFTGGVYVAVGDLNGDGRPELAISPDEGGGPRVRIFSGKGFSQLADFLGIDDPDFRGGARVAIGDLSGDGVGDLVVAAGFQGGPRVAGFDGLTLGSGPKKLFGDFLTFEPQLRNGSFVAVGDLNGDGWAELIAGGGPGGGPRVTAFSGKSLLANEHTVLADFFAGDTENRGGVRLAVKRLDDDSKADLLTGSGTGGGSRVTAYLGKDLTPTGGTPTLNFDAFPGFTGGVFVG